MTPEDLAGLRGELEAFAAEVFAPLHRCDQQDKGLTYLRGLLLDGRRKSMQPMAERLGVDHQRLQQFVSSSTWPAWEVRHRIAARAVRELKPDAWVVDDTGFPKDGTGSPGVARQYSGTLGKVGNCQIGVSVHAVTDTASCPLDRQLFLPTSWDPTQAPDPATATEIEKRRTRCKIPSDQHHRPKWELAIEMLDQLSARGLRPPVVVADAGYGDNTHFRHALDERGLPWIVQVKGQATAHSIDAVTVTPPTAASAPGPNPATAPGTGLSPNTSGPQAGHRPAGCPGEPARVTGSPRRSWSCGFVWPAAAPARRGRHPAAVLAPGPMAR